MNALSLPEGAPAGSSAPGIASFRSVPFRSFTFCALKGRTAAELELPHRARTSEGGHVQRPGTELRGAGTEACRRSDCQGGNVGAHEQKSTMQREHLQLYKGNPHIQQR